ncbi:MAG: DUF3369 domain-containing protein [Gammaproteobacteria bacterium]|nr:DUF3369 domain-containing protein [Gammaproteobacteria bacterium]
MSKMIFAKPSSGVLTTKSAEKKQNNTWKILISDDEEQVHEITKLALTHFSFSGKKLEFISAFTGEETKKLIIENPDVAIILQDVVMETDTAGLDVVKFVREELNNKFIRIILRTGQPGQAPERKVIVDYDINDYKEKTELTSQKLFTLIYSSLRSFQDINTIERNKVGLQKIIDSTSELFSRQSIDEFLSETLMHITKLFHNNEYALLCDVSRMQLKKQENNINVISSTGKFSKYLNKNVVDVLSEASCQLLQQCFDTKSNIYQPEFCIIYFSCCHDNESDERLLYFSGNLDLSETDKNLINLYIKQAEISLDNLLLSQKIEKGQREIVNLLGTSIETRSKETGNHIKRVAEFSAFLAKEIGMDKDEIQILKLASPLHDLGKIGISDAILNKPGKLESHEWQTMMTHPKIGYDMLRTSDCEILQAGAIISYEHHEKWDGSGYPENKKGNDIHIYGRITAVADVFDALACKRCYKEAWLMEDIIALYKKQRGAHFDPELVDIFLNNTDEFIAILEHYKD